MMEKFDEFLTANRAKIYADAKKNGTYNKKGQLVMSRTDEWNNGTFHDTPANDKEVKHSERIYKTAAY